MKKIALLLLLLPSLVLAQGLNSNLPWNAKGGRVLASFPLSTTGPLITEDANTVAHVYWNGTALVDTKGNSWTMNGTVPQVSANPFTTTRYGAGPFSAANTYSSAANTPLDFAGDFTLCVAFYAGAGNTVPLSVGAISTGGYEIQLGGAAADKSSVLFYRVAGPGFVAFSDSGAYTGTGPNITCLGRSGVNGYVKTNLATTATAATTVTAFGAGATSRIGSRSAAAVPATNAVLYEIYGTSTAWNEAAVVALQQKVLGHYDGTSPLAVTRTTNATYEQNGATWTVPAGVARINSSGLLVEPARTNYALQSNTMSTGTAATGPWATIGAGTTVATVAGAPMGGTWAEVTTSSNLDYLYAHLIPASSNTLTWSVWAAKASGTGYMSILGYASRATAGTVFSACTCSRSDGGACTATISPTDYNTRWCRVEVADLGTTPVRIIMIGTLSAATTDASMYLSPGQYKVSTGTTRFSGAQLEVGTYPTSLIVTTTTALARNADQVSATVPAVPVKWCLAGSFLPEESTAWNGRGTTSLFSLGAIYANNNLYLSQANLVTWDTTAQSFNASYTRSAVGQARVVLCSTAPKSYSLTIDSVSVLGTPVGAGAGYIGGSTFMYFGRDTTGAGNFWGGYLKNLKLCSAKSAKECR